jgi:hypothetical protein
MATEMTEAQKRLEVLLMEGLASESSEMTRLDWDDIRRQAAEILKARSK